MAVLRFVCARQVSVRRSSSRSTSVTGTTTASGATSARRRLSDAASSCLAQTSSVRTADAPRSSGWSGWCEFDRFICVFVRRRSLYTHFSTEMLALCSACRLIHCRRRQTKTKKTKKAQAVVSTGRPTPVLTLPFDLNLTVNAYQGPVTDYYSTEFGVDTPSIFPFGVRTNTHLQNKAKHTFRKSWSLTLFSLDAYRLPQTIFYSEICVDNLSCCFLESGQADRQTDRQTQLTSLPMPWLPPAAGVGNKTLNYARSFGAFMEPAVHVRSLAHN